MATTDQILGYIRIQVLEAKDIAAMDIGGTSDPFAKVYYHGFQNKKQKQKTAVREKTLNPTWTETFHSWILRPTSDIRVEVWDWDRLKSDDFGGLVNIPVVMQDGYVEDKWYTLVGREGKNDKHVKGIVRVRYEVKLLKRVPTFIWKVPTYILIDPNVYEPCVEIQGDVDDDLMMIICSGLNTLVPSRTYDTNGSPLSWKISFPDKSWDKNHDRCQNIMIKIWNRLKEMGWFFAAKSGDNLMFLNYPHPAPWYVSPPTPFGQPSTTGYLVVEQLAWQSKFEFLGDIDLETFKVLIEGMDITTVLEDDQKTVRRRIAKFKQSSIFLETKKNEYGYWRMFVKILNTLASVGYIYVSDITPPSPIQQEQVEAQSEAPPPNKGHIMFRDVNTYHYAKSVYAAEYLLIDPRMMSAKIGILGNLDIEAFKALTPNLGTPEAVTSNGERIAWEYSVPGMSTAFSTTGAIRRENRWQNYLLNIYDALTKLGYKYLVDIGKMNLLVRTGEPITHSTHLLVDFALTWPLKLELQGPIDGSLLKEITSAVGLAQPEDVKDKDGTHLCWSLNVPNTNKIFISVSEGRRMANRVENYMIKMFDALNKLGYDYLSAQGKTHLFLRKQHIPNFGLSYLFVNAQMYGPNGPMLELQGQIQEAMVYDLAKRIYGTPERIMDTDEKTQLCWAFKLPWTDKIIFGPAEIRRIQNRIENYVIRVLDGLYQMGWIIINKADTGNGLFLIRYA